MCCGRKPVVKLIRTLLSFRPTISWADGRCVYPKTRQIKWVFYINGSLAYSTPYNILTTMLPIGTGSTYGNMVASNTEIVDYLIGQGFSVPVNSFVQVRVNVRNCDGETATSNPVGFISTAAPSLCLCDFTRTYSVGSVVIAPSVGGQVAFINGLLNAVPITNTIDVSDEIMVLSLSGTCGDVFETGSVTTQIGNVTVPPAFLAACPDPTKWMVSRNGVLQSAWTPVFGFGAITPSSPSLTDDQWLFVGLSGGDCGFKTILGSTSANGTTIPLPIQLSASNAAKWFPVKNGVSLYNAANSVSGYTVSGNNITFEDALVNDEIWYILLD
jgi:hypothetical protein